MTTTIRKCAFIGLLVRAVLCCGCSGLGAFGSRPDYIKPTIAVMRFDNRAPFDYNWDIGGGLQDVLVDRLVATGRYHVVERQDIDSVMRELSFQQGEATRKEGRAPMGRLKNVKYLVKGVVTDFGHVTTNRGAFGLGGFDIFGGGNRAVMSVTLQVVDVESGEILASQTIEQSVRAGDMTVKAAYKDMGFGGSTFYRTPLGRATTKVIGKAVRGITKAIRAQPWQAKLASVHETGTVVINGGSKRGLRKGMVYEVRARGQSIVDPDTGDVIGNQGGKTVGQVRVSKVRELYSVAEIVSGKREEFQIGQICLRNGD